VAVLQDGPDSEFALESHGPVCPAGRLHNNRVCALVQLAGLHQHQVG